LLYFNLQKGVTCHLDGTIPRQFEEKQRKKKRQFERIDVYYIFIKTYLFFPNPKIPKTVLKAIRDATTRLMLAIAENIDTC
jgi:hypothetical protein